MNTVSGAKKITLCAVCIALCYVLPLAFHSVGLGGSLSPMHIPVLLCGLICGAGSGFLCGIAGPIISSLLSGMPPVLMLIRMIPELCAYGLVTGYMMKHFRTGKTAVDVYVSLFSAMLTGRLIGGIATTLLYTVTSGVYSIELWLTGYFIEATPGMIVHLILIPLLDFSLEKARLLPVRYPNYSRNCCR